MDEAANTPEAAWLAFRQRKFNHATRITNAVLERNPDLLTKLPIAEIWTLQAYHLARSGRQGDACTLIRRVLNLFPEDRIAQQMLLIVEDELAGHPTKERWATAPTRDSRLVLGVGTGRSGSTTLSALLDAQPSARVTHEAKPILYWDRETNADDFHIGRFRHLMTRHALVGDVAHWWLPKLPRLIALFPSVRIIALKRDKQQTVESFLRIKGGDKQGAVNHWVEHDGQYWTKNHWDGCYPKFNATTLKESIELYWDTYTEEIDRLSDLHPANVRTYVTESLSDEAAQADMLSFIGVSDKDRVLMPGLHQNQATVSDGAWTP